MKIAYFDCSSGISGDMCLGALLHAGVAFSDLVSGLSLLPIQGYRINCGPASKNEIRGIGVSVLTEEAQPHRHLSEILAVIDHSSLPETVREKASAVFSRLAEAEGAVHGLSPEQVHFHEVGGIDAIVDVVGTCICLSLLGIERVVASPLPMGHGFIDCAHGRLPLPAPATQILLKNAPVYGIDIEGELVTPTGAALIMTLADSFGPCPGMLLNSVGFGAGEKEFKIPNMLRVSIGQSDHSLQEEEIDVIETTIDDMNPEIFSYLWEKLFAHGALDMFLTPVQMKKGRPGVLLTILTPCEKSKNMILLVLRETTSLGVRVRRERRFLAPRRMVSVPTGFGDVKVKVSQLGNSMNIAPEYEDCRRLALENKVSLKEVYLAALSLAGEIIK